MRVEQNAKFGVFFLSQCTVKPDVPQEEELEPGVWVSRRLGIEIAAHWREWLGSLTVEALGHEGLAVYATAPSKDPEVSDEENVALQQRINDVLNTLLFQGVPRIERGFVGHGANVSGELRLRSYTPLGRHYFTDGLPALVVGMAEIRRCLLLARRLRYILDAYERERSVGDWKRLIRGLRILLEANRTDNTAGDRLHQFVRAVEALIKPSIARSRRQFAHRGQTFVVPNAEVRSILLQLYDLRSAVEHLHVPHDLLPRGIAEERIAIVGHRTRQADALARSSLLRVLEDDALFSQFRTDAQIDAFWDLPDHERLIRWGPGLNITSLT